ncbi:endonuclease/exonuclease/phosphatase family protein [Streptomyces fuscigenes]|uniref:endonuclease/exonuclease/phosphatase family protein n=1 Tax=Streptomyces fuscigenes TaxID=1528880 RepID=UPI0022A88491
MEAPGTTTAPPAAARGPWRRGAATTAAAVLAGSLLLLHGVLPEGPGHLGSLLETLLPWVGLAVPVLLAPAFARRAPAALLALLFPGLVWLSLYGGTLADKRVAGGDLTVVSHNVDEANRDPAGTARALAASGADVVGLEELGGPATGTYERMLDAAYRHHRVEGTVGLWSRYPLTGARPVAIMPWTRALRATVATPRGDLTVFVAHLASVRVAPDAGFTTGRRDDSARLLAAALPRGGQRLLVMGDFNGTLGDRALAPVLVPGLRSAQDVAGDGFGFTWPARFPVARIDQVLVRGVRPLASWTLPRTGSDHLPVAARLRW